MNFREYLEAVGFDPQAFSHQPPPALPEGPRKNWYGYYCGPGPKCPANKNFKKDPNSPEPIDDLDAQCQQHDQDYCDCGLNWKAFFSNNPCAVKADERLVRNVQNKLSRGEYSGHQGRAAKIIANLFSKRRGFDRDI